MTINELMAEGFTYKQAFRLWRSTQSQATQEALSILHDISEANTCATRSISAAASAKAAEREWVRSMQDTPVVPKDEFFVCNTDRITS